MQPSLRTKNFILAFVICVGVVIFFMLTSNTTVDSIINGHISYKEKSKPVPVINDVKITKAINDHRESIKKNIGSRVQLAGIETVDLKTLQLEAGGKPIRSVIVTSWRSGSTFLGDILNTIAGNFYFYEPLMHIGVKRLTENHPEEDKEKARSNIRKLLECDFSDMEDYLEHAKKYAFQFEHNHRLWSFCSAIDKEYCFSPSFLQAYCRQFPFISMKVIRSSLEVIQDIVKDEASDTRVLLLVRDPRPTLNSRWQNGFCAEDTYPECGSPEYVCDNLIRDFRAAEKLSLEYPKKFMRLRFEDLALNFYLETGKVLSFFGLPFNEEIKKFLDSHTKEQNGKIDAFSTFRNTTSKPIEWLKELSWDSVSRIQLTPGCDEAMKLWGYKLANSEDELKSKEFYPLL